jgi:signal transduction histidine kinase
VIDGPEEDIDLSPDQATGLFRIIQETLNNISKHAGASRVAVRLAVEDGSVMLEVVDNGRGLGLAERRKPKSFGIRGMVERAHALGGALTVGDIGQGCRVAVRLPLASAGRANPVAQASA